MTADIVQHKWEKYAYSRNDLRFKLAPYEIVNSIQIKRLILSLFF